MLQKTKHIQRSKGGVGSDWGSSMRVVLPSFPLSEFLVLLIHLFRVEMFNCLTQLELLILNDSRGWRV